MRVAPFHHVLTQYLGAAIVVFIGHHEAPLGEGVDGGGGFAAGSGAGVEIGHRSGVAGGEQPYDAPYGHGRGILHVVEPLVHGRIVGEVGPHAEISPFFTPWHTLRGPGSDAEERSGLAFARIEAHGHRGVGGLDGFDELRGVGGELRREVVLVAGAEGVAHSVSIAMSGVRPGL